MTTHNWSKLSYLPPKSDWEWFWVASDNYGDTYGADDLDDLIDAMQPDSLDSIDWDSFRHVRAIDAGHARILTEDETEIQYFSAGEIFDRLVDTPIAKLGYEPPPWINADISVSTVQYVGQCGCSSGAYMPACLYSEAARTMEEHGDAVLEYLEGVCDDMGVPATVSFRGKNWAGLASDVLQQAVDAWCMDIRAQIEEVLA